MDSFTALRAPDYKTLCRSTAQLQTAFPFLRTGVIGHSLCRRKLLMIRLGRARAPVLLAAGFHAQEWLTCLVLLRFARRVCAAARDRRELCGVDISGALDRRELIFLPCMNPDGVEIALHGSRSAGRFAQDVESISCGDLSRWNANARGVDLNHNFDAGWQLSRGLEEQAGISGPAPRRFGGSKPESEPESAALAKFVRERRPRTCVALHSQGEEIFYKYGENTPEKGLRLAKLFAAASGYELVENDALYSHAGFKDWVIAELGSPAFTFELGRGENPLPLSDFESVYEKVEQALVLACIM